MRYCLITVLLLSISVCTAQPADKFNNYELYSIKLSLPSFFGPANKDEHNTYDFPNSIDNNISLSVECLIESPLFTPSELSSYHDDCLPEFSKLISDITTGNVFIISGLDKKGKFLYIKGVKKGGSYYGLSLRYSKKFKALFDKNLPLIADSFQ